MANKNEIKCTDGVCCPYCKSKNIRQSEVGLNEEQYPFMVCCDCGKISWSD